MHEMVLANGRDHFGGYRSVAVLILVGLGRNVVGLPDVDECTRVHLELYKANAAEPPQRERGHPSPSHGSAVALEIGENESIRYQSAHVHVDQFRGMFSMWNAEEEEEVIRVRWIWSLKRLR